MDNLVCKINDVSKNNYEIYTKYIMYHLRVQIILKLLKWSNYVRKIFVRKISYIVNKTQYLC